MKGDFVLCLIFILLPWVHGAVNTINMTCVSCPLGSPKCGLNCTSPAACVALTESNTLGGNVKPSGSYQGCIDPKDCRPLAFTLTTAAGRYIQSNMACCSKPLCNEGLTLTVPPVGTLENGVFCPACEIYNQKSCESKSQIACKGIEEKCITLAGDSIDKSPNQSFAIKGCATESACSLQQNDLVPFGGKIYKLSAKAACTVSGVWCVISSSGLIFSSLAGVLFFQSLL
ncbi:phospholipase A2 inhibitor and Ly6/PLAUR domain-containing protein-like [Thamnophis elegans]|uniref:phospholipase A2 inhibitor and Ly6/PLAUR domain-containing protein-like n=1 Tax=Thamnophis elegans TaxID=35005 RepID=UPI00137756BC|nr:phospholipase A2 inhibitor and Ly6/PLAUR domain-containing protein-like [Thamnophis elegans]